MSVPYDSDFGGWSDDRPLNWDNPIEWDAPPEWDEPEFTDIPFDDDFDPDAPPPLDTLSAFDDITPQDLGIDVLNDHPTEEEGGEGEYRGTFVDVGDLAAYLEEIWWLDFYVIEVDDGWEVYVRGTL